MLELHQIAELEEKPDLSSENMEVLWWFLYGSVYGLCKAGRLVSFYCLCFVECCVKHQE